MKNANTSALKLSGLTSGVYTFRLTATDNEGNTGSDEVIVTVDAPPVVDAGADRTVTLPLSGPVYIAATATDSDGTIAKYLWSKYSGPNVNVENTTTSTLKINTLYEGIYVFKLAVTDNLGVQTIDYVTVTVTQPLASSRMSTAPEQEEGVTVPLYADINEPRLGTFTAEDLKDCTVIIYTGSGEQIYRGAWSAEQDRDVLRNGLYIYHVIREGRAINSGKVYRHF